MRFLPLITLSIGLGLIAAPAKAMDKIPDEYKTNGFAVGCQAWSFNNFTVKEAIELTHKAGGKIIEFFPGQALSPDEPNVKFDHHASDEVIAKVKRVGQGKQRPASELRRGHGSGQRMGNKSSHLPPRWIYMA